MVDGRIPVQGHLTDDSGSPLNGDYSVTFRIYDDDTDGTVLCQDTQTVSVSNGLFSTAMDGCTPSDIDGTQVYLGIQVGSDEEMTPRQPVYPVPYAMSLVPGADLRGSLGGQPMFTVENTSSEWSSAIYGYASATSGENYGVEGRSNSTSGYGGYFRNNSGVALKAAGSGIIQSTAQSYVWISGNGVRPFHQSDSTVIDMDTKGGALVYCGATSGTRNVMLPITVPGPLYGQDVTVSDLDIYFRTQSEFDTITAVLLRRQAGVGSYDNILHDSATHGCDDDVHPDGCTIHYDLTSNNVLSADAGILYLTLELTYSSGGSTWIQIGGVRLTLEHD